MTLTSLNSDREQQSELPSSSLVLTPKEFATISLFAREHLGIELGAGKEPLVAARLGRLMRRLGYTTVREYYEHAQADRSGESVAELMDALTTNHTSFFREQAHFDFLLGEVFPHWDTPSSMRIWSAASSTGEEPYSIALTAREYFGRSGKGLPFILASDISRRALETARRGTYRIERMQNILDPWLNKHLLRGEGQSEGWYRMRPEIMAMIDFRRINLIKPFPDIGTFSVISCRNVMIYFNRQTQEQVVNRLAACLAPGGYLFVGHSESLTGIQHDLQHVQPAIYRKRGGRK